MNRGILLSVAAALFVAFAWQSHLATFGDDSASYLTLAHYFSPWGDPAVARWAGFHSNFPPLFPLALALTGGAFDLRMAGVVIALFAAGGLYFFSRHAKAWIGEGGAFGVVFFFLFTATAWVSLKGVLSETLFLLVSMAGLAHHQRLTARPAPAWEWWAFGLLLACAPLTRVIGFALPAAYLAFLGMAWARGNKPAPAAFIPFVPVIALWALWSALRPRAPVDAYDTAISYVLGSWQAAPSDTFVRASYFLWAGWLRSLVATADVSLAVSLVFGALGVVALVGVVVRAARNRLDGWYALLSLGLIFAWVFSPETTRRLLYPLVPLLLLFVAMVGRIGIAWAVARFPRRLVFWVTLALIALPAALCLMSVAVINEKAIDLRPVIAGCPQKHREIADYYWTAEREDAEKLAVLEVTMLCGLQSIDKVTPPGAVVMWVRPEYVALLGRRPAAAYYYAWTDQQLAHEIAASHATFFVTTLLDKTDLAGAVRQPNSPSGEAISAPVFSLSDGIFEIRKVR